MTTSRTRSRGPSSRGFTAISAVPGQQALIDTVRFKGTVADFGSESFDYLVAPTSTQEPWSLAVKVFGRTLRVQTRRNPPTATFECSLPKLVHGHNVTCLTVDEAHDAIDRVVAATGIYVQWAEPVHRLQVQRLDLVRDFSGADQWVADCLVHDLARLQLPHDPSVMTYAEDDGYTSLHRGKRGRWKVSAYAKQAEVLSTARRPGESLDRVRPAAEAAKGLLRTEVQLRRPVVKEKGVPMVGDLTAANTSKLHRTYFDRAGLGTEIGTVEKVKVAAMLADKEAAKQLPKVVAYLWYRAAGMDLPWADHTIRKLRRTANLLGLTEADVMEHRTVSVRLDYDTAQVLVGGKPADGANLSHASSTPDVVDD